MVMFRKVPDNSPLNAYEPYTIIEQTHQGFVYESQITGQKAEVTDQDGYEAVK